MENSFLLSVDASFFILICWWRVRWFSVLAIMNNIFMNMELNYLLKLIILKWSFDKVTRTVSLEYTVFQIFFCYVFFKELHRIFHSCLSPIHFINSVSRFFYFPTSVPVFVFARDLSYCLELISHCGSALHFWAVGDVETWLGFFVLFWFWLLSYSLKGSLLTHSWLSVQKPLLMGLRVPWEVPGIELGVFLCKAS